ncbi:hypothetical protein, partial [Burkholderia sp. SIMBA_024]|uniref:hypothetical protein n=1 Tax=Burkholderia sp. SIMBA_024 TaxID=3085768 RepID=UPI00397AD8D2
QETKQEIREGMKEIKEGNYSRLIHSIVTATPDETNISHLERKQELTQEERHQLKHWKIEQKYGVPVDEELVRQDDEGLHPHLSLQFWLTVGRNQVAERDKQKADSYLEKTEGKIYA